MKKMHNFESKIRQKHEFPILLNLNEIKEIGKRTVEWRFHKAKSIEIQKET